MAKHFEITLRSGREIRMVEIKQFLTYAGLIEGLPTIEMNRRNLEWTVREHRNKHHSGEPYLVRPVETPIDFPADRKYPFGTPSKLPSVTCVARFQSRLPARDVKLDYSELVVIWLRDEFALPVCDEVMAQLPDIPWETVATDLEI